ncbi:hypothetical protein [Chryseobacterium sp. JUb7]|uniref:hypothetical protein n=1 Tax=Chryseobacterium sp. JUb7 TaxID=2940599 RepID=UPI0021672895|nr:hypothetical protein [Chryseobacterium sp. JUb7]MCS3529263.1 hypothetical protein [Chryseobacterium sp. JUb7]
MKKNVMGLMFKNREDSMKMRVLSIMLLVGFALFSALVSLSKISFSNLMIYSIAFVAYVGFSLVFISSLTGNSYHTEIKKRASRHS